jgi:hypothetical protein
MKKIILILVILLMSSTAYGSLEGNSLQMEIISKYDLPSNTTTLTAVDYNTKQTFTIIRNNSISDYYRLYVSYSDRPTGIFIKMTCQPINKHNYIHNSTLTDAMMYVYVESQSKSRMDYILKPDYNITKTRLIFLELNPSDLVVSQLYTQFSMDKDYRSEPICYSRYVMPAATEDNMIDLNTLMLEEEITMADEITQQKETMKNFTTSLIEMIYEILLIFFWVIKILLTIFVISTILWIFIWFYKLVKKLLEEL